MDNTDALPDGQKRAIAVESRRLEESAMYGAQMQFEQAKRWRGVNLWLGLPACGRRVKSRPSASLEN
jgi:hypothetical protein